MKVTKTVVGTIQVGQNPRPVCLTEGVCLAQAQQCSSSAADKGWRFVLDAILLGHWLGPGKNTHGTMGPEQQEGCGWPV